jgi:hypothetical protein
MTEFGGESSQTHVNVTTRWMLKMKSIVELVEEDQGTELKNERGEVVGIAPTIQEFFDNLTGPITSEKVVGADFDFPSFIGDVGNEDTRRLKDVYRVVGGSFFSYGKAMGCAMNYMTALKSMSIVNQLLYLTQ